jgi:hypothetical protein
MKLRRFYAKKPIELAHVRAVRDVLKNTFNWNITAAQYHLFYQFATYTVKAIDEADKVVKDNGQPINFWVMYSTQAGRTLDIETRDAARISIDVHNLADPPEQILNAIEPVLGLEVVDQMTSGAPASTAFIAHVFDEPSQNYANELARFLSLLSIRCYSGRAFSANRVSDKVNSRLAERDLFFSIVTPHDDFTWVTQEISTAAARSKPLFILKQNGVALKEGLLGDHEYIPFASGELSRTFIPILEGINELCGRQSSMFPWASDKQ